MRANLVRIGNSRGLRIPKPLLEACGIHDRVELRVEHHRLVVEPARGTREGWAEAAEAMAAAGDDEPLQPENATEFDDTEWEW